MSAPPGLSPPGVRGHASWAGRPLPSSPPGTSRGALEGTARRQPRATTAALPAHAAAVLCPRCRSRSRPTRQRPMLSSLACRYIQSRTLAGAARGRSLSAGCTGPRARLRTGPLDVGPAASAVGLVCRDRVATAQLVERGRDPAPRRAPGRPCPPTPRRASEGVRGRVPREAGVHEVVLDAADQDVPMRRRVRGPAPEAPSARGTVTPGLLAVVEPHVGPDAPAQRLGVPPPGSWMQPVSRRGCPPGADRRLAASRRTLPREE